VKAGEQEQVRKRAGVDQRKREGRDPAGERSRKEKQDEEKLLRVQTQACTIQPLWMGRTHAA